MKTLKKIGLIGLMGLMLLGGGCSIYEKDQETLVENHGDNNTTNFGPVTPAPTPVPTPIPTVAPVAGASLPVLLVLLLMLPGCVIVTKDFKPSLALSASALTWKSGTASGAAVDSEDAKHSVEMDSTSETAASVESKAP